MSFEKLVMELYGRVTTLESLNQELVARVEKLEELDDNQPANEDEIKFTRSVTRKYVIEQLKKYNPTFSITKGNREMGADLLLQDGNKTYSLKVNFYHSKSHDQGFVRGWHTVKQEDLANEDIECYVFLVEYRGEFHTWLFTRVELKLLCQQKEIDSNNLYHFYFTIKDGKNYEARDSELDVSNFYKRWDVPSKRMMV